MTIPTLLLKVAVDLHAAPTCGQQSCSDTSTWRIKYSTPRLPARSGTLPIHREKGIRNLHDRQSRHPINNSMTPSRTLSYPSANALCMSRTSNVGFQSRSLAWSIETCWANAYPTESVGPKERPCTHPRSLSTLGASQVVLKV